MRPVRSVLSGKSLQLIGIPEKFHGKSLDDFYTTNEGLRNVKDFMQNYIASMYQENHLPRKGIIFSGSNGVGKTMLSSLILQEAYRLRYSAKRVTFSAYISEYTRVWSAKDLVSREEVESALYNNFKSVDYLVLEELGKEIRSEMSITVLEDLLRHREDRKLLTFICTNLRKEDILSRYGESCMSLIKGNMIPITIDSVDFRGES